MLVSEGSAQLGPLTLERAEAELAVSYSFAVCVMGSIFACIYVWKYNRGIDVHTVRDTHAWISHGLGFLSC